MPKSWRRTQQKELPGLKPPLTTATPDARPEFPERAEPQWDIELQPGMEYGASPAKGDITLRPPEY